MAVKMGKKIAPARGLPAQAAGGEGIYVDLQQDRIGDSGKMPARRLAELRRGRKMDEAVARIMRRAAKNTARLRRIPLGARYKLIDRAGRHTLAHALPKRPAISARVFSMP